MAQLDMLLATSNDVMIWYVHVLAKWYSHAWQFERPNDRRILPRHCAPGFLAKVLSLMLLWRVLVEAEGFICEELSCHRKTGSEQGKPRCV